MLKFTLFSIYIIEFLVTNLYSVYI